LSIGLGSNWHINRYDLGTGNQFPIGGVPIETPTLTVEGRTVSQVGTGQVRLAMFPKTHTVIPRLEWTQTIQKLASLIAPTSSPFYVFAHGETPLTLCHLRATDGVTTYELDSGYFDSCEIRIRYGEAVTARLSFVARNYTTGTYGTHQADVEAPMDWTSLINLELGADVLTQEWREVIFRVNNNVGATHAGTQYVRPMHVFQRQVIYSGTIRRVVTGQTEGLAVRDGTKKNVVIWLRDNASQQVTTEFRFVDAAISSSREEVPELDVILETISWEAGYLSLSTPV